MFDYTTKNSTEFIKSIQLVKGSDAEPSSLEETDIKKVFEYSKANATSELIKDLWPSSPTKLTFITNYDFSPTVKKMPDSAYAAPVLYSTKLVQDEKPLEITVTPYPEGSCWRLTHSSNIKHIDAFDRIYSGIQTVSLTFRLVESSNNPEYCWIKVIPATQESISDFALFRFFLITSQSEVEADEEASTSPTTSFSAPLLHWSFDSETPFLDNKRQLSLITYKNKSNPNDHIAAQGVEEFALRSIYYDPTTEAQSILVNEKVYKRFSTNDKTSAASAIFCWYNAQTADIIYTASSTPEVGDIVYEYNSNGSEKVRANAQVEDLFVSDSNYFCADVSKVGIDISDPTKDFTLAAYIHQGQYAEFGFKSFLYDVLSYYTSTPYITKTGASGTNAGQFGSAALNNGRFNSKQWAHIAITRTRVYDATDPANAYTPGGRGFVVVDGAISITKLFNDKTTAYPYIRDPDKDVIDPDNDENSRLAYTFRAGVIPGNDTVPVKQEGTAIPDIEAGTEISTVWIRKVMKDDRYVYFTNSLTATRHTNYKYSRDGNICRIEYRDDLHIPVKKNNNEDNLIAVWTESAQGNGHKFTDGAQYVIGYCWYNGVLTNTVAIKASSTLTPPNGNLFHIKFTATTEHVTGASKFNGLDDIRLYDRMLYDVELEEMGAKVLEKSDEYRKAQIQTAYLQSRDQIKIRMRNSWYYYEPDLTVFYPTAENPLGARFGWRKLPASETVTNDPNDPENIWTDEISPVQFESLAIFTPDGMPEIELDPIIKDVKTLEISEVIFKCDLVPYVIDSKTIGIVINTHDEVVRCMRRLYPGIEAIAFNSEWKYITGWQLGYTYNCRVWLAHKYFQAELSKRADIEENWSVNGQSVELVSRMYTGPYGFKGTKIQWRNCPPTSQYYSWNPPKMPLDGCAPEIMQIAYIRLNAPMEVGNTYTISWCNNTCSFEYGHEFACSSLKVNQEGYLPWSHAKYAYLGRWMGANGITHEAYTPPTDSRTFYLVPYSKPTDTTITNFSGTMVQRCAIKNKASEGYVKGMCSDLYGQGVHKNIKPMNAENVFQIDFSDFSTTKKDAITINGVQYFRDELEDYVDGTIKVNGITYSRDFEHDTCNAYAWYNANGTPARIYTDTHIPTTSEQARTEYEHKITLTGSYDENGVAITQEIGGPFFAIQQVTSKNVIAWTKERITEEDYNNQDTVWTDENPSAGSIAHNANNSTFTVQKKQTNVETQDISGLYQIYVPNIGWSFKFMIHPYAWFHTYYIISRGLFHQRSGCSQVKHPYTNWEYLGPGHEMLYDGNFCPNDSQANNSAQLWAVDPDTLEELVDENGARYVLDPNGYHFSTNRRIENYNNHPLYGIYGGWFDAADFDMREVHIPIIGDLAMAYIRCPDNFSDKQLDLPESGDGIPDILSEALWGAELYRKAQTKEGAIRGWFEARAHESDWPWESNMLYHTCAPSLRQSATYASSAARLARALLIAADRATSPAVKTHIKELAKVYTESACDAFMYSVKEMTKPYYSLPDSERGPSSYFWSQDKLWAWIEFYGITTTTNDMNSGFKAFGNDVFRAALALYILTREERFKAFINEDAITAHTANYQSEVNQQKYNVMYELVLDLKDEFPDYALRASKVYIDSAEEWCNYQNKHAYRWLWFDPAHKYVANIQWGFSHPDGHAEVPLIAWMLLKRGYPELEQYMAEKKYTRTAEDYRSAVYNSFDNVLGCNNLGRSWIPAAGSVYPVSHLDSWLPKNKLDNDIWTSRPGICPYYMGDNAQPPYKSYSQQCGQIFEGRDDQNCGKMTIAAYPAKVITTYGEWKNGVYFKNTPFTSAQAIWLNEEQSVAAGEYTVWETIHKKAMMIGMLMGQHHKPKFWYKQIAPKKTMQAEIRNFSYLP